MGAGFTALDWTVIGSYFGGLLAIGWFFRSEAVEGGTDGAGSRESFFLGGRQMPWVAVLVSVIATEISAVTFLGVPSVAFAGDFGYLQFGLGSLVARFVVAWLFLPAYYRYRCATPYEWLEVRFDREARRSGAVFFLISRLNASAVRLLLAAMGVGFLLGWSVPAAILLFCGLAMVYTAAGGLRTVIYTDALQAAVFVGGGVAVLGFLVGEMGSPGEWNQAVEAEKFRVFHFGTTGEGLFGWLNDSAWFWIAFVNGLFMTVAALGCDQDLTQRLLACRNLGDARKSVILSGMLGIPVAGLFLLIGSGLYQWYGGISPTGEGDREFAWFILNELPAGLRGFLVAGIFAAAMSSLDSAMNALSSSLMQDFGKVRGVDAGEGGDEAEAGGGLLRRSRLSVVGATVGLGVLAFAFYGYQEWRGENLVWLGFRVAGITLGPLLGVFVIGFGIQKRIAGRTVRNALLLGGGLGAVCLGLIETGVLPVAWSWVVVLGAMVSGGWLILGGGSGWWVRRFR